MEKLREVTKPSIAGVKNLVIARHLKGLKMRLLKLALAPMAAAAMMAISVPAGAAVQSWILNTWGGSGNPGAGPWGTVTVTEVDATHVSVNVALTIPPSVGFVNTGNHTPFTFNLNDAATSITVSTAGFSVGSNPPFPNPSFGDFTNGIVCSGSPSPSGCGNGGNSPNPGPLNFSIFDADGINISSFVGNAGGWLFAADILANGFTGAVGTQTPAIPEPETYAMMLVGVGLLGWVARRRKQSLGNLAVA